MKSIINVCSLGGAIVLPFMKKKFYKQLLIFMVGLAVGSLAASGLLVLVPEREPLPEPKEVLLLLIRFLIRMILLLDILRFIINISYL